VTVRVEAGVGPADGPVDYGPTMGLAAQFALFAVLAAGIGLGLVGWLAGTAYAVVTWTALSVALRRAGMRALGPANAVTLARATLVGGVTALAAVALTGGRDPVAVVVILATLALVLDAVDGKVARRTGSTSPLGARFDVETDSFLALVLSAYVAPTLGWWVLAIGLARYAFVAAALVLPWLRAPLPPRMWRKTVAATQGIVLVVAASGVVWRPLTLAAVAAALALLAGSFGRDVAWLWRTRPAAWTVLPSDKSEAVANGASAS
jgi:phosphatidylglycerophosphate synthase